MPESLWYGHLQMNYKTYNCFDFFYRIVSVLEGMKQAEVNIRANIRADAGNWREVLYR